MPDESNQPRAKVEVTGSPEQVAAMLDKTRPENGNSGVVDEDLFFKLLTTPSNDVSIHVDRISPKEWKGRAVSGWIEEFLPPVQFEEIQDRVRATWGGGRYRVRILKGGKLVSARGMEIAGDPRMHNSGGDDDERSTVTPHFGAYTPGGSGAFRPPMITDLNRDPEVINKRKEIELLKLERERRKLEQEGQPQQDDKFEKLLRDVNEKHEREMAEVRRMLNEKDQENKMDRMRSDFMTQFKSLEDKLASPEHRGATPLKELKSDFEAKMTKLQQELSESVKAIRDTKEKDKLEEFKRHVDDMRRDFEQKLTSLTTKRGGMDDMKEYAGILGTVFQNSGQRDKELLNQMFTLFQAKMDTGEPKNETGRFAEFLEVLAMAQDVMGGRNEAEPAEPKDFGTAFLEVVKEAIPQISDAIKNKNGTASREEIERIVQHNMQVAQKNVAAKLIRQRQLPTSTEPEGLEDTVAHAAVDPVAEKRQRVTVMFKAIAKELPVRPRVTRWLDFAFDELPEDVLDAVAQCTTPKMFLDICKPDVEPGLFTYVVGQLQDQAKAKWFADTLVILRREYAKMKTEDAAESQPQTPVQTPVVTAPAQTPPATADQHMQNPNV
jgi:hypothetical protein